MKHKNSLVFFIVIFLSCLSVFAFSLFLQSTTERDYLMTIWDTVKFLNFRTPENFAVIYLKFKQRGQTLGYFVKMETQTVKTLIRLLL